MLNDEIKSRILMEMNEFIGCDALQKLKMCLDRNFYGVTMLNDSTDIVKREAIDIDVLYKKFMLEKKIEGLSNNTIDQYIRTTIKFFGVIKKPYTDVNSDDINYYLATLLTKNVSTNYVDNSRKYIKAFFKWLYEKEYIKKDVFLKIKPIKRIEKPKDFLTGAEIVTIRDACKSDKRALALIDFLLSTGVRVSECSNLKINDINFNNGEVNIYATKTNQWRKVYLDSNALKHLTDYLSERKDSCPYVFVSPKKYKGNIIKMSKSSIENLVQKYCVLANINRHCYVHLFRKTLATRLYERGMDISIIAKILGHNSVKTTEKYYLSICDKDIGYMYYKCS